MGLLIDVPVENEITQLVAMQSNFFATGKTLSYEYRLEMLSQLKSAVISNEQALFDALKADLDKSKCESYVAEICMIYDEINYMIKHLKKLMKPKKVKSPRIVFPAKSLIYQEPYGVCLVFVPWNYPVQLALIPIIGAIAGGNCCVIKCSEFAVNSAKIIEKIIQQTFAPEYINTVTTNPEVNEKLLATHFDKIFFTGSPRVGKIVMAAAAKNLTPVTLELGGKSPCIVDETADLKISARRIVWGKCLNAGQTCVAPDYLLVQATVKEKLVEEMKNAVGEFYGNSPLKSEEYAKIINERNFRRLKMLMQNEKIILGGGVDDYSYKIEFTLIDDVKLESKLMEEEIFGPILPIIPFDDIKTAKEIIQKNRNPLGLYLFSEDKETVDDILKTVSFGSGCVNDTLMQASNLNIPFGGIGNSGMGSYHGKKTFEEFSHSKGVVKKFFFGDFSLRYPPYGNNFEKIKKFIGGR